MNTRGLETNTQNMDRLEFDKEDGSKCLRDLLDPTIKAITNALYHPHGVTLINGVNQNILALEKELARLRGMVERE